MPVITKDQEQFIPYGDYCYRVIDCKNGKLTTNTCPFGYYNEFGMWDCLLSEGQNGEDGIDLLLADQVKGCGINISDDDEP